MGADEALYVGDMTIDAQTGSAAGVKTVVVLTGSSLKEEVQEHNPYEIITSIDQLPQIIEKLDN